MSQTTSREEKSEQKHEKNHISATQDPHADRSGRSSSLSAYNHESASSALPTARSGRSQTTSQQQQASYPPRPRSSSMGGSPHVVPNTRPRDPTDPTTRLVQPHGVAATGPSSNTLPTSSSYNNGHSYYTSLQQQSSQSMVSIESPLPPVVQRSLGDRSNEKRKNAALEIEALVKSLQVCTTNIFSSLEN